VRSARQSSGDSLGRDSADRLLRTFLLLCGALPSEDATPEAPTDWEALLPCLRRHRLCPLACWVARTLRAELPDGIHRELESAYYGAALRYDLLRSSLARIADAFSVLRGPVIVLKGPALAERLYPSPACRPMEDLDLLVRTEDLPAAAHVLASLGYTDRSFGPEDFRDPDTGIVVDLHTELLNTTRLSARRTAWHPDLDRWRARAAPFPLAAPASLLHPQDHLVYLCHHTWLHHGLRKPLALLDVCLLFADLEAHAQEGELLRRPDLEAARRGLWYALSACGRRFGLPLSERMRRNLRPADAGPTERLVHALAVRGRLPENARYGYLWLAIPPRHRLRLLSQCLSWSWTGGGRRCARTTPGSTPSCNATLDPVAPVLYHSPPESPTREGDR
jgi:hypothetical protein